MKIVAKIFPKSKINSIEERDGAYFIRVTAPAIKSQANIAIIKLLAEYFKTSKNNVEIVKGHTSRYKIIEIS